MRKTTVHTSPLHDQQDSRKPLVKPRLPRKVHTQVVTMPKSVSLMAVAGDAGIEVTVVEAEGGEEIGVDQMIEDRDVVDFRIVGMTVSHSDRTKIATRTKDTLSQHKDLQWGRTLHPTITTTTKPRSSNNTVHSSPLPRHFHLLHSSPHNRISSPMLRHLLLGQMRRQLGLLSTRHSLEISSSQEASLCGLLRHRCSRVQSLKKHLMRRKRDSIS